MKRKEILQEFIDQWDTVKKDNIVTLDKFEDYYTDISASIDRDDIFETLLRESWKTPELKSETQEHIVEEARKMCFEDNRARFYGIDN